MLGCGFGLQANEQIFTLVSVALGCWARHQRGLGSIKVKLLRQWECVVMGIKPGQRCFLQFLFQRRRLKRESPSNIHTPK